MSKTQKSSKPADKEPTILDRVQAHYERFIAFANPHHPRILALWTLHTWVFESSSVTPYIYVSSIDPGAGKTTLMETAVDVARNAEVQAGVTPASIYRSLIEETPTFIIDEADAIWSGAKNDALRRVINSGYKYNGYERIFIDGESQRVGTYCPKMLGGIDNGQLPATIMDRSIRIRLRKLNVDELAQRGVELRNLKRLRRDGSIEAMQEELSKWANIDTVNKLDAMDLEPIAGVSARQWEITQALVEIARLFGKDVEKQARESIVAVFQGEKTETPEVAMLRKVRDLFEDTGADKLPAAEIAEVTGYTPDRMGRILSQFGAKSRPMKIAGEVSRGYHRVELEEIWTRMVD